MFFTSHSSRSSLSSISTLFTAATVLTALAFAPGCSSGDVPIGQDGTSTRSGDGTGDGGSTTDGGGGGEPAVCVTDSDCTGGDHCGYLVAQACSAKGVCLAPGLGANCGALIANCACDGTAVYTGCTDLPQGYASKPVETPDSACGAADGGGTLPSTCTTSADCGTGALCGYKETDACSATGTCFASSGALCNSIEPACACDGTIANAACNGLPGGYTLTPVLYPLQQTCATDADGGADAGTH